MSISPALGGGETVTYQWTDNGTPIGGATSSTFTPNIGTNMTDGQTLRCEVTIDGTTYTSNGAPARYASGAFGALSNQSFTDNTGNQTYVFGAATGTGLTWTYALTSPPAGVSIVSATRTITHDTDALAVQAGTVITVTATDQYGRPATGSPRTYELTISDLAITAGNEPASLSLEDWQFPADMVKQPWLSIYNYESSGDRIADVSASYEVDSVSATGATDLTAGDQVDVTLAVKAGGRTNHIPYSDLSSGWAALRATLGPVTTKTVGGVAIAGRTVTDNGAGGSNTSNANINLTVDPNTWYTFSFYAADCDWVLARTVAFTQPPNSYTYFDVTNVELGSDPKLYTKVEDVGGGVVRCILTFKTGADTTGTMWIGLTTDNLVNTITLDGTNSMWVGGVQLEKGRYASALVQTSGTPASSTSDTRNYLLAATVAADSGDRPVYAPTNVAHALVCRDTAQFANTFNDGFALFGHVEYDASNGPQPIFSAHRTGGVLVAMRNQKIAVSNDLGSTWTEGSSTLTAGTYGVFVRYDGTALSAWVKPHGGSIVKEIDAVTVNFTAAPGAEGPVCWGGSGDYDAANFEFPENGTTIEYYAGAVWDGTYPSEAQGTALLNGTTQVASLSPFWEIDVATGEDKSGNVCTFKNYGVPAASLFLVTADSPSGRKANFAVLKDVATGQPVQYDAGAGLRYWGIYNTTSSPFTARLATSTDLATWADAGAASGIPSTVYALQISDFVAEAGTFHVFTGERGVSHTAETRIYHYTTTDMATFSADAANPVFTRTPESWWTPAGAYGSGVEDFTVIKRDAGDYVAFYEIDEYEDAGQVAVGGATGTSLSGAWAALEPVKFENEAVEDGFLTVSPDTFLANPAAVTDGTHVWLFAEGATFDASAQGPTTYAYKAPIAACTFRGAWEYLGIVTYEADDKSFVNDATIESGVVQIYCQSGPTKVADAGDGVRKVPFNPAAIYTTQALVEPTPIAPVNPSVSSDSYTAPSAGTAASFNVVGGYSGSDTVDAYFALGDTMTVSQAQLIAKSGGTGVDAFFSVAGVTITGGSFDFTEAIEAADLTVVTSLADASSAAQLKYVVVERNNGGTTGVLTAGDTITSGDFVVPTFSSAEVGNVTAATVVVDASETLYGTPNVANATVKVGGTPVAKDSASLSGGDLRVVLSSALTGGETVLVSYDNSGGELTDVAENALTSFTDQSVTNNVSSGPTFNAGYSTQFATASDTNLAGYVDGGGTWSRLAGTGTMEVKNIGTDAQDSVRMSTTTFAASWHTVNSVSGTNPWALMRFAGESTDNNETIGGVGICLAAGSTDVTGYTAQYIADNNATPTRLIRLVRHDDGSTTTLGSDYDTSGALETSGDDEIRLYRDGSNVVVQLSTDGGSNWTDIITVADTTYTSGLTGLYGIRGANGRYIDVSAFSSGLVT